MYWNAFLTSLLTKSTRKCQETLLKAENLIWTCPSDSQTSCVPTRPPHVRTYVHETCRKNAVAHPAQSRTHAWCCMTWLQCVSIKNKLHRTSGRKSSSSICVKYVFSWNLLVTWKTARKVNWGGFLCYNNGCAACIVPQSHDGPEEKVIACTQVITENLQLHMYYFDGTLVCSLLI